MTKALKSADLFEDLPKARKPSRGPAKNRGEESYTAADIEGLEPVRGRPGMYIGGTDENGRHRRSANLVPR